MSLPAMDFVVIGVQKTGTSYLYSALLKHPEVFLPKKKELHYFDNDRIFINHTGNYDDLEVHFKDKGHRLSGEITPIYMFWPNALERIKKYNPSVKIIVVLRCPVDRAFSQWKMEFARGFEKRNFEECVSAEIEGGYLVHRVRSYVQRGFYAKQLERVYELFPKNNIGVFKYEWLKGSPSEFLDPICEFLGVEQIMDPPSDRVFSTDSSIKLNSETRQMLLEVYGSDLVSLQKYVDWEFNEWKD